jgi:hypothetical protein
MRIQLGKVSLALVLLLPLAAGAGAAAFTAARRQQQREPRKVYLPKKFLSEVRHLKVESHRVEEEGTPEAKLRVVIRNKSSLAVTKVSVTIGDLSVGHDGGASVDEPETVIEPLGTKEITIPLSNFIDDSPLVISEAIYADGTEEGREQLLRWTHESWKRAKEKRAAKKGGPEQ